MLAARSKSLHVGSKSAEIDGVHALPFGLGPLLASAEIAGVTLVIKKALQCANSNNDLKVGAMQCGWTSPLFP